MMFPLGWQMVPPYREPIIPKNSFAGKKTICIFAAQNRTTNPKIDNNEEQQQQRTDSDEQHKECEQEDGAEGKPKMHSSRSKCSTQGGKELGFVGKMC
jgi:hypothetical protein